MCVLLQSRGENKKIITFEHSFIQGNFKNIWKTQHETEDKEIQTLSITLPFVIECRLAVATNKKCFRGWKNW